ncbi:MAG TPA: DUF932 domain-containing protein [Tepidisphaeraceae bacterium]|nr:DUF932 domain-containing protein [Tepidisphaeraceae bacterium]
MAHNIHIENGKACLMVVRQPPWHGLGTVLNSPPTAAQAMKAANLDWQVRKVPLYAIDIGGAAQVLDRFAVVPEHRWGRPECPVLGVVGREYVPLQNADAFSFFDEIVGAKAAEYETAGALGNGERVWILAKLPGQIHVVGDDITHKYLLLANGHDGRTCVQIKLTPVRVVCQNTLTAALNDGKRGISVHHGRGFWNRMRSAQQALGIINHRFVQLESDFKRMADIQLDQAQLDAYLQAVFPDPKHDHDRFVQMVRRDRDECGRLFETGPGNDLPKVRGTLWAAFNGVTGYVDHVRGGGSICEQRLKSIWFGRGQQIKWRAYSMARQWPKLPNGN